MAYGEDFKPCHRQFKRGGTAVEMVPIPGRQKSAIDDATSQQVKVRHFKGSLCNSVPTCQSGQDHWKNLSWPFAHGKVVCSMDCTFAHTFTKARIGRVC